jgi:hypothetical protein
LISKKEIQKIRITLDDISNKYDEYTKIYLENVPKKYTEFIDFSRRRTTDTIARTYRANFVCEMIINNLK